MKLFSFHIQFETVTCCLSAASRFNATVYSSYFTAIFIAIPLCLYRKFPYIK